MQSTVKWDFWRSATKNLQSKSEYITTYKKLSKIFLTHLFTSDPFFVQIISRKKVHITTKLWTLSFSLHFATWYIYFDTLIVQSRGQANAPTSIMSRILHNATFHEYQWSKISSLWMYYTEKGRIFLSSNIQ